MPVTVLSWNVHHRPDEGPKPRRYRHIADLIRASAATVCCLQEVGPDLRLHLPDLLPTYHCYGQPRSEEDEATPVLVRRDAAEVEDARTWWLGKPGSARLRSWDARHPRCVTTVELRLPSGPLAVASCHLDHRGRQARVMGADQLVQWAGEHRPAVIAGDLNAGPGGPAYRRLVGPTPRLQDARTVALATSGPNHTWTAPGGLLRRRIDHLLVDHDLQVTRHTTLTGTRSRRAPSDHSPVVAELVLPGED